MPDHADGGVGACGAEDADEGDYDGEGALVGGDGGGEDAGDGEGGGGG